MRGRTWRPVSCEPRAKPGDSVNALEIRQDFVERSESLAARGRQRLAAAGQILPGRLPPVNHTGEADPAPHHAAMAADHAHLWTQRERGGRHGAGGPARRRRARFTLGEGETIALGRRAAALRTVGGIDASDRAAGARGPDRAPQARGQARPRRARCARRAQDRAARRHAVAADAGQAAGRPPAMLKDGSGDARPRQRARPRSSCGCEVEIAKMARR